MAQEKGTSASSTPLTADRLWAEQMAMGMALLVGILIFMAVFHPAVLSSGMKILGPNYLGVYGWASAVGIILQVVVHEVGTIAVARWMGLPLSFRFFPFGANCTAILEYQPRRAWIDAVVGFAGPVTGSLLSVGLALVYFVTSNPENPENLMPPFFLGMACVGYFYNLFTLIPILDLEGGWIAPAIAPQAWLFGLVAMMLLLTGHGFNLVLLVIVSFALPRLFLLISARATRADLACSMRERLIVNLSYFVLVLMLAWLSTATFDKLPDLIRDTMGD